MSEPFPPAIISDSNSPMPSPSPASGSTSTLFLAYPVFHLSKMDADADEKTSSPPPAVPTAVENGVSSHNGLTPSPPPSPRATPISTPATPAEVAYIPNSTSPAPSTETGTPITPSIRPRPPNMSFASLNMHAQTLGHSITQREGLGLGIVSSGSPAKADGGQIGGGGQIERVADEAKMSPRGFVQPHRNHLPRRVKAKVPTPSIPALQAISPDLTSAAEGLKPGDTVTTTINATPVPSNSSPTAAPTKVAEDLNSSTTAISTFSNPPTTSPPSSSPHLPLDKATTTTTGVSLTPPRAPLPSSAHPHRNSSPGPSPLGGNLPRRIVSKHRAIRHPLSLSALASAAATPPSGPPAPHSASGAQTPTSIQRTPLRSSLRTPGKTPLRSAALAESPFMSSESGSDGDGDRGVGGFNLGSPRTSGAAVVGSTPVHTPARGLGESVEALRLGPVMNVESDQPVMTTEMESGLKKKGKGRRATFGPLPFPIHGEPRSAIPGAEPGLEDVPIAGPARLAIASASALAGPFSGLLSDKASDTKCTQYVGARVYVGFLVDDESGGEDFWGIPVESDDGSGEEGKSVLEKGEDEEKERMRKIVLRVLEEEELKGEEDPNVVVDVVAEGDGEAVEPPSLLPLSSPPSSPPLSAQNLNSTVLAEQDPAPVPSSSTSDSHGQPEPPPHLSPSSSPPLSAHRHRHELKRRHRERELIFTLPPLSMAASSSSSVHSASELTSEEESSLAQCNYVDGVSVLSDKQMRRAWLWMKEWMMGVDEDVDDGDDGVFENRNDSEDYASERDEGNNRSGGSRSRARTSRSRGTTSMSRKDGTSSAGGKTKSKSRRRSSRHHRHRHNTPSNIRIEILAPQERRVDAMGLGIGYLYLAHARVGLPGDDLEKLKDEECQKEGVYTPLHLMWMRLMDVGVRLDDHGDDYHFDSAGSRRKRSLSRKRSVSRKRSMSRKRTRSQSRLREMVDVDLASDVDEQDVPIQEPDVNTDIKLDSNHENKVQIEPVLDPPNPFQFNVAAANVYSSSSSSSSGSSSSRSTSSSRCSSSQSYSSSDDDLDLDPCGYTDEDQPSDSRFPSLGADKDGREISTRRFSGRVGEQPQTIGEAGEQITVHDIREEWRGVFSFDGLGKIWSGVEAFRSG